jgi:hypothetical protein
MELRRCKLCQTAYDGRRDKIFCSTGCKSDYHNHLRAHSRKVAQPTDKILHRNRSVLFEMMEGSPKQKKVDRDALAKKNFRFEYITGFYENEHGKRYHLVYDFAWMGFKSGKIMIVKRK